MLATMDKENKENDWVSYSNKALLLN